MIFREDSTIGTSERKKKKSPLPETGEGGVRDTTPDF